MFIVVANRLMNRKRDTSEGESSRTGKSRLNPNSHKRQIVVSNVTKYLLKRKLIIQGKIPNKTII